MVSLPATIPLTDIPIEFALAGALIFLVLLCGCCWKMCCSVKKPTTGEHFRWPNSDAFLRKTKVASPPKLIMDKYTDPMRTDVLPEDMESHWTVVYQPNGDREEVTQMMYLRLRDGIVFGVGLEHIRKLCKISGKYKHNAEANQTVLTMTCKFANDLDTVLFHGWGNGTGFVGNCYIHEIDRFATFSSVPGIRQMSGDKFSGSFFLRKMPAMGDPHLRLRLHTRRVHKWAGKLFPDETVTPPSSPLYTPGASKSGDSYFPVSDTSDGGTRGGTSRFRASRFLPRVTRPSGGGGRRGVSSFLPWKRVRRQGRESSAAASSPPGHARSPLGHEQKLPAWVRPGARGSINEDGNDNDSYGTSPLSRGRSALSPSRGPTRRPPSQSQIPIETMNYLEVEGVPGRSGPAMV